MTRVFTASSRVLFVALLGAAALACNQDLATAEADEQSAALRSGRGTVAEVIAADPSYSTLLAAVEFAGLTGALTDPEADLTVLAPNNAAFETALASLGLTAAQLLTEENKDLVTQILLYHVIAGVVPRATVASLDGGSVETLQGEEIDINSVFRFLVRLNGSANVIDADNYASNGIVHGIDQVLLPPSLFGSSATLFDVLANDPSFSTLVAALEYTGLDAALSDPAVHLTLLAPDNRAFERTLSELGLTAADLLTEANLELTKQILLYHVIAGELRSADVRAAAGSSVATLQGEAVEVSVLFRRVIFVNGALVRRPDIDSTNGVAHQITRVLLPPSLGL